MEYVTSLGLVGQRQLKRVMHAMRDTGRCFDLTLSGVQAESVDRL